jgi:hypothetical protein
LGQLRGWQRGVIGTLVVLAAIVLMFADIILFG